MLQMEDEELPEGQFWLPPEFFTDDFFPEKGRREAQAAECPTLDDGAHSATCDPFFPMEFPYGWGDGSDLSSPVDSVTGTESSDEEEDYMAGLIRQMSRHSLRGPDGDGSPSSLSAENRKAVSVEGNSPQSTLSELRTCKSWSRESSSVPSLVSSPLSSHLDRDKVDDAWVDGTLDAAAPPRKEQRRESDHPPPEQGVRSLLAAPAQNPSPSVPVSFAKEAAAGNFAGPSSTQQLQGNQQLKRHHQAKAEQKDGGARCWQKRGKGGAGPAGIRPVRPLGLPAAAWPPLQQPQPQPPPPPQPHAGSGMRAVFLSPPSRKQPCGTGVFLPRMAGSTTELRKKPPCSTVLLPAKVVQALNLDLKEIGAHPRFPGAFVLDRETMAARSSAKRRARQAPAERDGREARLPPEWTY